MHNTEEARIQYEHLDTTRSALVLVFVFVGSYYLTWRLGTFNPDAIVFSLALYGAEAFGFVTALLHLFLTSRLSVRRSPPVKEKLKVAVLIPTINEPVEIVRTTLVAAIGIDYPNETWLLDDGHRKEMRELAASLGCGYIARTDNKDAKAGNLNNALAHTDAEYIAIFDADHAPRHDFLHRTLGFFQDPKVAFVQTPQDFYNLDSYQHRLNKRQKRLFTEQSLFFRIIMRGKDAWNSSFFCGSCAVLRRAAIEDIGGFATGTVTEDLHTSIRLHKHGWRSVYFAEPLAYGLAPASVEAFLIQRIRWGTGAMQVWRKEGILLSRGLTLAQRFSYLASVITYFDGWQKLVFYLAPAVVLLTGTLPISQLGWSFILHLLPYYLLTFWVFEEVGRGYGHSIQIEQYNMARFHAFVYGTLGLLKPRARFHTTNKLNASSLQWHLVLPQYLILGVNSAALIISPFLLARETATLGFGATAFNIAWALINIWLASAVLIFTHTLPHKRRSYRFPLPLPATAIATNSKQQSWALADELSPSGARLTLYGFKSLQSGERLLVRLHLPGSVVPLTAQVMHVENFGNDSPVVRAGARLSWQDPLHKQKLERFLYGSDLQWRLNELSELGDTPIQRIAAWLHMTTGVRFVGQQEWETLLVSRRDNGESTIPVIGAVRTAGAQNWTLLLPSPAVAGTRLILRRLCIPNDIPLLRTVQEVKVLDSPYGHLFLCHLSAEESLLYAPDSTITAPVEPSFGLGGMLER